MPTPAKTSLAELATIARTLVEASGPEALTMGALAQGAGVKAPSLYKHFADRAAILKAVEIEILNELEAHLRRETRGDTPKARLAAMAAAYRRFGLAAPNRYKAIYSGNAFNDPEIRAACLFSAQPLFEELKAAGIAEPRILPLSRTLVAFLHGFVLMEIGNAFQLGGDIEEAFEASLETILREV
ncbi:MAG: TetR/AcrR family transcriptional regulator [Devosia sp.]|uniref:TetR/AcrR family transcriptional regulator n=1 Tax=Devosia sp. TaxID=1871048 RepID=UPI002613D7DB|nr:TetR/AcrR family transcriptional regulator [Devosia sp.]MDB5540062.1 TetR/AcrR family transcriptional regulator [Devosia sp.]